MSRNVRAARQASRNSAADPKAKMMFAAVVDGVGTIGIEMREGQRHRTRDGEQHDDGELDRQQPVDLAGSAEHRQS